MRISVCIPAKNEEEHLARIIPALRRQTVPPDIIVALAPSKDRSEKVALKLGAKVVKGGLPGYGRNRAAEKSQGDIIFFLDADVMPCCDAFLEHAAQEMLRRGCDVATVDNYQSSGKLRYRVYYRAIQNPSIRACATFHAPRAIGTCIIATVHAHHMIGGFDEKIAWAEDVEYVQRAAKRGFQFAILSRPLYIITSPRRLEKDGVLRNILFGLKAEWHRLFKGEITDVSYIDRQYFRH
jgi:glycosyltransferase involved in cell wall biosynthesis